MAKLYNTTLRRGRSYPQNDISENEIENALRGKFPCHAPKPIDMVVTRFKIITPAFWESVLAGKNSFWILSGVVSATALIATSFISGISQSFAAKVVDYLVSQIH
jgi:hypothetical protein